MLQVNSRISIPDEELRFTFARSSGPGGQNVNKVASKATLHWSVTTSPSLPDDVRARFLASYPSRITKDGDIVISSQEYRDQPKNIASCLDKLAEMLRQVAVAPKKRKPKKPTKGSKVRRLAEKRFRSEPKRGRSKPMSGD